LLNIKINRPQLANMCGCKPATYWQNFTDIYLAGVKILQKVLGEGGTSYRAALNAGRPGRSSRKKRGSSVYLSVCPFVCQKRGSWQNGRKICPDFYTMIFSLVFWEEE